MKETAPALPQHIGPYRVTGRLGRGGMGEVLRGHDDRLDRPVALKRIRPGNSRPEKARRRFRREARAVAKLSHSAIVQVYDWVEAEDGDWLVMELVDGRTLEGAMKEGPLAPRRAAAIARQVASGLAAAHGAGLVHRDLKAANVMLIPGTGGARERAKILDFGIAKPLGSEDAMPVSTLTAEGQLVGTVHAMSPEQALGHPVDQRSDLFSLGSLLYEMLSGGSPFAGSTAVETLSRICSFKQTALHRLDPQIPEDLSRLVDRLLVKEPMRRPADARQVVEELGRWLAPRSSEAQPADRPRLERTTLAADELRPGAEAEDLGPPKPAPRRLSRGLLAAAGALAMAGLWGLSSWLGPPGEEEPGVGASATAARPPDGAPQHSALELYQRGMALLERYDRKGNVDEAIADFQRAMARDETSAPALAGLARAYWLDYFAGSLDPQRLEQALAAARRAVELDPYLAIARVSLGMVHFEMGDAEAAVRELGQALQLEPLNAEAHFGLSRLYDSQGDLSRAEEEIRQAIEAPAGRWYHHAWLGTLHLKAGRYPEAEAAFRRSLDLAPDNFRTFRNLGVALYMQGHLAEAASQFQQALQIQADETLYANLGTIYFAQGLYPQSVSAFEKAIGTGAGSNNYLVWGNLGDAYRWTPDNERRAQEAFLRAIQLLRRKLAATPRDLTLRTQLALYLAKRGDCDPAVADVTALQGLPGKGARAWFRLAVASELCGRRETALTALARALEAGFSSTEVEADPELLELRQDVRYHRLVMGSGPAQE